MTRKEQRESRRKEILMKALELFTKKGFSETKISDIADSVPMSVGLLFHYFESKEQLCLELIQMGIEGAKRPEKLKDLPPEEFFETFLSQLFEYAKKEPWVFRLFILMGQARSERMPEKIREAAQAVGQIEFSAEIIRKGQETGVFREGDPILLSTCFWASVQGVMEEMAAQPEFSPNAQWLAAILKSDQ